MSSDGSNTSSQKILLEPLKNIGAQDLLQVGYTFEGVLRKKGGRFDGFLGSTKWKRRYVVISQGCVYCFKNEYANRPQSAFSLAVYESVAESASPHMLHTFEIRHEDQSCPPQCFAAETDPKRRLWMANIQEAITQTHLHSGGSRSGSDEGIVLSTRRKRLTAPLPPIPSTPTENDPSKYKHVSKSEYSLESDDEEPYDEVVEVDQTPTPIRPKPVPLPIQTKPKPKLDEETSSPNRPTGGVSVLPTNINPPSHNRHSISNRPVMQLPPTPGRPKYENGEIFKEEDYMFHSKDKDAVQVMLRPLSTGTFLVRQGNKTRYVLSVKTDIGVKEFQISEDGSKASLDKKTYFPSVGAMLVYYNQNDLPKNEYTVKLERGYKT